MDAEREMDGVVRSSREANPGCLIGGVDSGLLNGTSLGGDVNLEKNFLIGKPCAGA